MKEGLPIVVDPLFCLEVRIVRDYRLLPFDSSPFAEDQDDVQLQGLKASTVSKSFIPLLDH